MGKMMKGYGGKKLRATSASNPLPSSTGGPAPADLMKMFSPPKEAAAAAPEAKGDAAAPAVGSEPFPAAPLDDDLAALTVEDTEREVRWKCDGT